MSTFFLFLSMVLSTMAIDEDPWSELSTSLVQALPRDKNPNPKVQRMERSQPRPFEPILGGKPPRPRPGSLPRPGRLVVRRPAHMKQPLQKRPETTTGVITRQPEREDSMTAVTSAPMAATTSWSEVIDAQSREYIRIRDEMNEKDKKIPRPACDGWMESILGSSDISEDECSAMKEHYDAWRQKVVDITHL